ncbi:MAG TPA: GWxTD domain-containing protein [Bryobacteraceae bacterium]|nr:GWxTD domain-containing protein [Bryobacteraceae bacterium]
MKSRIALVAAAALANAASGAWLDLAAAVMTPAERKIYLSMNGEERAKFEEEFWSGKAITAEEYKARVQYIDAQFGSGNLGSGAHTDQGRVYLALGPPDGITRIASSRTFQPIEIWRYSAVPGLIDTEIRLMFFQKNGVGAFKLYSPVRDTIRALLLPQASNAHLFGPNDDLNESQIREKLQPAPGEDEVVSAAVHVSAALRYEENDEILGKASSPSYMLRRPLRAQITSRFIPFRPKLDIVQTPSPYAGSQVDLGLEAGVQRQLGLEVIQGESTLYQNRVNFKFTQLLNIRYKQRLDLLPGAYRLIFTVDGKRFPYALDVPERAEMGEIARADQTDAAGDFQSPFSFQGAQFDLNADGNFAFLAVARPQRVMWTIRRGTELVWRAVSEPAVAATVALPTNLPPGSYTIEANAAEGARQAGLEIRPRSPAVQVTAVCYRANLAPGARLAFIGRQWLLRGRFEEARKSLAASLEEGASEQAQIELARVDAAEGRLDNARDLVRRVLAAHPDSFEGLSVLAYIEAKFQDYSVAADLYRRALAVQDSPAVRAALAEVDGRLPGR